MLLTLKLHIMITLNRRIVLFAFLIAALSFISCEKDDDSQDDLDFNFNLSNEFEDLSDDWDIISQSSTKIELIDVSGGNGGTDYLSFQKN